MCESTSRRALTSRVGVDIAERDSRQLVLSIYYQRFRKGFDSSLIRYMQKIQALWNCKKLITFSVPKTKLLVVLDYDKRRPSLCLQEEKNSVRLLRAEG